MELREIQIIQNEAASWAEQYKIFCDIAKKDNYEVLTFEEYFDATIEAEEEYWLLSDDTNYAKILNECNITPEEYKSLILENYELF